MTKETSPDPINPLFNMFSGAFKVLCRNHLRDFRTGNEYGEDSLIVQEKINTSRNGIRNRLVLRKGSTPQGDNKDTTLSLQITNAQRARTITINKNNTEEEQTAEIEAFVLAIAEELNITTDIVLQAIDKYTKLQRNCKTVLASTLLEPKS